MPAVKHIVFMGTADFAVPALRYLIQSNRSPQFVVTQPDRPKGRGRKVVFSPVKEAALAADLEVVQPETVKHDAVFRERIEGLKPDLIIVAAFGQILPQWLLDLPRYGCINLHGSILPAYRGAAPIQWSVINGDIETGVTLMNMVLKMDAGDVLATSKMAIDDEDTYGSLQTKLMNLCPDLLERYFSALENGNPLVGVTQNPDEVTMAPRILREHMEIDWSVSARSVYNRVRGLLPKPKAFSWYNGNRLKIAKAEVISEGESHSKHGEIAATEKGLDIYCGLGVLRILAVIPENRGEMAAVDFVRGSGIKTGERLGGV